MKIALLFSSKAGMAASLRRRVDESAAALPVDEDEGDEPPPSDEFAECDSDETISAVAGALRLRHEVILIESDEDAYPRLRESRPDLVFNVSERLAGPSRESHIPVLCEILGLPYTGSDPLTLSLCLDKSRAKEILSYYGVPNPEFWIVEPGAAVPAGIKLPAIVKPLFEGSSKGIKNNSFVATAADLSARVREVTGVYRQPAIVERFLSGREFTVGVLGNGPNLEILPIVEIDHSLLAERRPSDLFLRGQVDMGHARKTVADLQMPRPGHPQGCRRRSRRSLPIRAGSSGSAIGAGSMSALTKTAAESSSKSTRCPESSEPRRQFLSAQGRPDGRVFV